MALSTEWAEERYEYDTDGRPVLTGLHRQLGVGDQDAAWHIWVTRYDSEGRMSRKSGPYIMPWSSRGNI